MRAQCIICSDLFDKSCDIAATKCGHTFHQACLLQWLERSSTCPQCRCKTTQKNIIQKLFFDAGGEESFIENSEHLTNALSSLKAELLSKEKEKTDMIREKSDLCERLSSISAEKLSLEYEFKQSQSTISALKCQLKYFDKHQTELAKARDENRALRSQLNDMKHIDIIMSGTNEEVENLLKTYGDKCVIPPQMITWCSLMKKELNSCNDSKRALREELKCLRSELTITRQKFHEKTLQNEKLSEQIHILQESLKSSKQENESLEKQIWRLEKRLTSKGFKEQQPESDLVPESPSTDVSKPSRFSCLNDDTFLLTTKEVKNNLCSSQSSSNILGFSKANVKVSTSLMKCRIVKSPDNTVPGVIRGFNLFKKHRSVSVPNCRSEDFETEAYDGLGGHSKADNFPKPALKVKCNTNSKSSKKMKNEPTLDR